MKMGLSESVLVQMGALLDQFNLAAERCDRGRAAHKRAPRSSAS